MAVKIAVCYALLGGLWILGSGWFLHHFVRDPALVELMETIKGWCFVAVTALLLGFALDRYFREIRRSAQMLQSTEQRWLFALEGTGQGVWDWNAQTNEVFYSARWKTMLGFEPHEISDTPAEWEGRVHPEDLPRVRAEIRCCLEGQTPTFSSEYRIRRKDGGSIWVLDQGKVVSRTADGKPLRVLGAYSDITERKHLEAQLRQAQKLDALGHLAGGVAHDFNNILAGIMMQLGLLQMTPGLDEDIRQALKDLDAQARRAASLTRQLLMFSRRSVLAVKPLDLNEVVANLLKMLRRLIGEQIDLRFDGKSALPMVAADAGMMEQVLMNLVVNARDAMPKGGRITISTALAGAGAAGAAANPNGHLGRFVCLSVSDTGCGMDAATLKRLFEPFFTTKEAGKGTGLGLATVHGIAAQHKGWVEVESQVDKGSTFRVYLPAAVESPVEAPQTLQTEHVRRGRETILLVEDELQVRRVVGQSLRALGYQVHEAGNGQEAMTLWQTPGAQIDLLLTDMVMPEGMTGLELTEQLQALKPGLKAIISSGYSAEIVQAGVPAKAGIVYLPKPYATKVLADVIRDCLDQNKSD